MLLRQAVSQLRYFSQCLTCCRTNYLSACPPASRSWYMLLFQSRRLGEAFMRHDGEAKWVYGVAAAQASLSRAGIAPAGVQDGFVGWASLAQQQVAVAAGVEAVQAACSIVALLLPACRRQWCHQRQVAPTATLTALFALPLGIYPPSCPRPASADYCELGKVFLESPLGPRTPGAFSQQVLVLSVHTPTQCPPPTAYRHMHSTAVSPFTASADSALPPPTPSGTVAPAALLCLRLALQDVERIKAAFARPGCLAASLAYFRAAMKTGTKWDLPAAEK